MGKKTIRHIIVKFKNIKVKENILNTYRERTGHLKKNGNQIDIRILNNNEEISLSIEGKKF